MFYDIIVIMRDRLKKYSYYILLFTIIFIGFILRLKGFIANPPLWHDETALGWNILNKSYSELFKQLRFLQVAPPLFLVCTKAVVFIFGGYKNVYICDMVLRLIPFLCGNLSFILFYLITKRIFNSKWSVIAALALFALNPVLINYSFEFKPYSIDVFCVLLAIYIFLKIDFNTSNLKTIYKQGLLLAILPWFSFASTFVILAGFITLSFNKENPKLFTSLLMPVFVSAFLYLKFFVLNAYSDNSSGMLSFWGDKFIKKDLSNLTQLNNENIKYFFMNIPFLSFAILKICAFVGGILFAFNKKYKYLMLSILTYSTVIIASIGQYYPFSRRMIIFLIPILIIYIAKITDIKKWFIGWAIFLLILIPHTAFAKTFIKINNINKGDFARDMMIIMAENMRLTDSVIINEASNTDYFYYNTFFKFQNKIEYIKPDITKNETVESVLNRLPKGKYWMFLSYDYNPTFANIKEYINWAETHSTIEFQTKATQSALIRLVKD